MSTHALKKNQVSLQNEERQLCEIYTRVMGYHRPVSEYNLGKQGEHAERKCFNEPATITAEEFLGSLSLINCSDRTCYAENSVEFSCSEQVPMDESSSF